MNTHRLTLALSAVSFVLNGHVFWSRGDMGYAWLCGASLAVTFAWWVYAERKMRRIG